ncbi:hypothetical protein BDZ89DRAFT_1160972 [Hymenopellis radicata]|nr:hypothetical protein BDZ89DRAFT_1160972 [Hymenopellis radicata]
MQSQPYPLIGNLHPPGKFEDPWESQAMVMSAVHNTFIRGINAILQHACTVPKEKIEAFMIFCSTFSETLHHHHEHEEELYFPYLEARMGQGTMTPNVEQHHAFNPHFGKFDEYIAVVTSSPGEYDAEKLKELVHGFAGLLVPHLAEEITTLDATLLREHVSKAEMDDLHQQVQARLNVAFSLDKTIPYFIACHDAKAQPWFSFPTLLVWMINLWPGYAPKYRDSWAFAPFDTWGRPRK